MKRLLAKMFGVEIVKVKQVVEDSIMPDGRPFWAWKNELSMLREKEPAQREVEKKLKREWEVLKIVEMETKDEVHSGDLLIRIKRVKMVNNSDDSFLNAYEVFKEPSSA